LTPFDSGLKQGQEITNKELCRIFKCSPQGGMRRSHETNTLIIVSDNSTIFYDDKWDGEILRYTGMGQTGDQKLEGNQNITLHDSDKNGVDVHLFEVYEKRKYTYQGRVKLTGKPYQETQKDYRGNPRRVWMFPLRLVDATLPLVNEEALERSNEEKERAVRRLSDEGLRKLASAAPKTPSTRKLATYQFDRNPAVCELAKRRAGGKCQLCGDDAPFRNRDGEPYLETHHVKPLSEGGEDSILNTVALCPNCHRKMHVLGKEDDKIHLIRKATENAD